VEEAHRRLADTNEDITNIAHNLGFSSSQYFATVFRRETGMTPGEYRETHQKKQTPDKPGVISPQFSASVT
jgi:AraC-like DNA-binding protein